MLPENSPRVSEGVNKLLHVIEQFQDFPFLRGKRDGIQKELLTLLSISGGKRRANYVGVAQRFLSKCFDEWRAIEAREGETLSTVKKAMEEAIAPLLLDLQKPQSVDGLPAIRERMAQALLALGYPRGQLEEVYIPISPPPAAPVDRKDEGVLETLRAVRRSKAPLGAFRASRSRRGNDRNR